MAGILHGSFGDKLVHCKARAVNTLVGQVENDHVEESLSLIFRRTIIFYLLVRHVRKQNGGG